MLSPSQALNKPLTPFTRREMKDLNSRIYRHANELARQSVGRWVAQMKEELANNTLLPSQIEAWRPDGLADDVETEDGE
jgi:hypothetical protein